MSKNTDQLDIDALLQSASKGSGAEGALIYLGDLLWTRLWRNVTMIANCDPEKKELILSLKSAIQEDMNIAQSFRLDVFDAKNAVQKIKTMYNLVDKKSQGGI